MHPLRPVCPELPSLCRTICRCCLPKVTKNLLLLLRSASLTTAHLHHLAPRSMLKGLLPLRLEDCASSHLKLAASRCSLSYAASTASCLRSRNSCKISSTTTCATAAPIGGRGTCLQHIAQALQLDHLQLQRPRIRGSIF